MSIYARRYGSYDGPIEPESSRILVIAETEVRRLLAMKWVRRLILMAFTPTVFLAAMLYFGLVVKKAAGFDPFSGDIFVYHFRTATWFVAVMMAAFGAAMIAKDVVTRAFPLYFTRPVSIRSYVLGKLAAIAVPVLGVSLLPGVLLAITQWALAEDLSLLTAGVTLAKIMGASVVLAGFASTVILLMSSLGTSARYVGVGWLGLFLFLDIAYGIFKAAMGTDSPLLDLMSLRQQLYDVYDLIFRGDSDGIPALVSLCAITGFCAAALRVRILAIEAKNR